MLYKLFHPSALTSAETLNWFLKQSVHIFIKVMKNNNIIQRILTEALENFLVVSEKTEYNNLLFQGDECVLSVKISSRAMKSQTTTLEFRAFVMNMQ